MDIDILKIANTANLKFLDGDKVLLIKHKLDLHNQSAWGLLFFLCGGIILIVLPFIKISDTFSKIIGVIIGILLFVVSVLTLIREIVDGLEIRENTITFRYNLKKTVLPISTTMKVKMKTEIMKIRRVGTLGSDFIIVTHYIEYSNKEIPVLMFQMDNLHADDAKKLGTKVTQIINSKFQ